MPYSGPSGRNGIMPQAAAIDARGAGPHRVVVVGAGFGGLAVVKGLALDED